MQIIVQDGGQEYWLKGNRVGVPPGMVLLEVGLAVA
jgi:hypothetical protein